jgi:DNA-binding NarL/FixJ family response regulator
MNISTVLIVEDEYLLAMALRNTFTSLGITVLDTAANFEDAVSKTQLLRPDLIVMDINLQGNRNGVEAAETIRNFSHSPIVFQSACTEGEWIEKASHLSHSLFLAKTISKTDWNQALGLVQFDSISLVA